MKNYVENQKNAKKKVLFQAAGAAFLQRILRYRNGATHCVAVGAATSRAAQTIGLSDDSAVISANSLLVIQLLCLLVLSGLSLWIAYNLYGRVVGLSNKWRPVVP
jgi:hypothetical protein